MERLPSKPSLILVFAVLGFMIAAVWNTNTRIQEARPSRVASLAGVVQDIESQRRELQKRLAGLRSSMSVLEEKAASESGMSRSFSRELEQAKESAGLSEVRGPGVEVILGDAAEIPPGEDPNDYVIHDFDVTAVLNALLAGGARAVSINGERVVVSTSVRCAGNTVLVNGTRVGNPYDIRAVGDTDRLYAALYKDAAAGFILTRYRENYRLNVSVKRSRRLRVPAFKGSLTPDHAEPLKKGDKA